MNIPRPVLAIILAIFFLLPPLIIKQSIDYGKMELQHKVRFISSTQELKYWRAIDKINKVAPEVVASEIGNFPQTYIDYVIAASEKTLNSARFMSSDVQSLGSNFRLLIILEFGLSYVIFATIFYFAFRRRTLVFISSLLIPPLGIMLLLVPERYLERRSRDTE
ncbi:hypothetical protein [Flavobacterium sp.]|uniref:hypothetical protein n=1 Tax=Flavobacterium sp. TaxID=239 RepID=UPI00260BAD3F|nr:hypothetical protein [Flavobacterium sp.]